MSITRISPGILLALAAAVGGIGVAHRSAVLAQTAPQDVPGMEHAMQLSNAFRHVSKQALPALVSIRTTGRVVEETVQQGQPFGNEELFRQFFGNDPRFRQFMERGQENRGPVQRRRRQLPGGKGSGVIISADGVVLTNSHVVADAQEVVVQMTDGREFTVTQENILTDPGTDVAIVRLNVSEDLPYMPLGDDNEIEVGDWVLALGSPFGLRSTVTQGIISAKARAVATPGNRNPLSSMRTQRRPQEYLQTDAAINPGNSGGPLVNLRGELVGINTAISTASGGYDGVGFAVPVSTAKWVADQLLQSGSVQRGFLGILMQPIDAELAEHFSLNVPHGVVVVEVIEDSPAEKAGFQVGDVILAVNERTISSHINLAGIVERLNVGSTYPVTILRNEEQIELMINVGQRPEQPALARTDAPDSDDTSPSDSTEYNNLGVAVQELTPELSRQLNVSDRGVLVSAVKEGSGAERAGIEPGMVISRVGNLNVSDVNTLNRALQESTNREKVLLLVVLPGNDSRNSSSQFVVVEFDDSQS